MVPDFSGLLLFFKVAIFFALLVPGLTVGIVMSMLGFKALTAIPVGLSALLATYVAMKLK